MSHFQTFTEDEAKTIGDSIGINWDAINLDEFRRGLTVELEHGDHDPETNVIDGNHLLAGKIAWAHLKEIRDYYTRLEKMESEAEAYWEEYDASNTN